MKRCSIVCGFKPEFNNLEGTLIGVDRGALSLTQKGLKVDVGIGDFDSCSHEEFEIIRSNCAKLIKLNPVKDDTDLEHTFNYCKEEGYEKIDVYGCLGGRQDHNLLNLKLLYQSELDITYYSNSDKVYKLEKGKYTINKEGYKYLSIFNIEDSIISIDGVKYPLNEKKLSFSDNFTTSNEILGEYCQIEVLSGKLLIIQSND